MASEEKPPVRIAVFADELGRVPRGIQRVARELLRSLVDDPEVRLEKLGDPKRSGDRLLFPAEVVDQLESNLQRQAIWLPGWAYQLLIDWLPPALVRFLRRWVKRINSWMLRSGWRSVDSLPRMVRDDAFSAVLVFDPQHEAISQGWLSSHARLLVVLHDFIPLRLDEGPQGNPVKFRQEILQAITRADRILCNSRTTLSDLCQFSPESASKAELMLLAPFRTDNGKSNEPTTDANVKKPAKPYFLFVGVVERRKNFGGILQAARLLQKSDPHADWEIVVVGDHSELPSMLRNLGLRRKDIPLRLMGKVDDKTLQTLLAESTAVLYPSLWEGFGLPILEAYAHQTLVITSDLGSMQEIGGPHAIYCDPYDSSSLAEAMTTALQMPPDQRQQRTTAAREYAQQFSWQTAAEIVKSAAKSVSALQNSRKEPTAEEYSEAPAECEQSRQN